MKRDQELAKRVLENERMRAESRRNRAVKPTKPTRYLTHALPWNENPKDEGMTLHLCDSVKEFLRKK